MKVLDIQNIPAPYTFEEHGGDADRSEETENLVSVSTIKAYIAKEAGFDNYDVDFSSPGLQMKAWLGLAFEDRLVLDLRRTEPNFQPHPGEFISASGRVMGHPDGFNDQNTVGLLGLDEFKHTYTSVRHYETVEALTQADGGMTWHYLFQARSYAAILWANEIDCRQARIWVLSLVGDWSKRREPLLTRCWVEWTPRDLEEQMFLLETDAAAAWAAKQKERG